MNTTNNIIDINAEANKNKNASLITYSKNNPRIWYASGVIIFNYDLSKTIIVKTPTGNVGFPKGGKENFEKVHQTAHREVREETGLKKYQYNHDNTLIGEKKGNNPNVKCSIYYFIGLIDNKNIEDTFTLKCFNQYELSFVNWVNLEDAYKMLNSKRQEILKESHKYIINKQKQELEQLDKGNEIQSTPQENKQENKIEFKSN
jgi:8-oxo-dGTP pyrophosphatase MutT (NUDIX family)